MCDFSLEDSFDGAVIGVDEVGRGPLAGPVVAAGVYIPPEIRNHPFVSDIKDSKKLSKAKIKILNTLIHDYCAVSIFSHSPAEIDSMNILNASLSAMAKACAGLTEVQPICALIDGNRTPPNMSVKTQCVIKGDSISKSIAAASIVAKYHRDQIMCNLHEKHPYYGWDNNVGYPTAQHRAALVQYGITPHHRKSFAPVKNALLQCSA